MTDLEAAQEHLARLNRLIAEERWATHQRVERCTGLDGDSDLVSRREWGAYYQRVRPLELERDAVIKLLVVVQAAKPITTLVSNGT